MWERCKRPAARQRGCAAAPAAARPFPPPPWHLAHLTAPRARLADALRPPPPPPYPTCPLQLRARRCWRSGTPSPTGRPLLRPTASRGGTTTRPPTTAPGAASPTAPTAGCTRCERWIELGRARGLGCIPGMRLFAGPLPYAAGAAGACALAQALAPSPPRAPASIVPLPAATWAAMCAPTASCWASRTTTRAPSQQQRAALRRSWPPSGTLRMLGRCCC